MMMMITILLPRLLSIKNVVVSKDFNRNTAPITTFLHLYIYINISIYTYIDTNIHLYSKDQKNTHMIACLACYHRKARNKASHLRITTRNPLQLLINSMKRNKLHAIPRTPDTFYVALLCSEDCKCANAAGCANVRVSV